MQTFSQKSLQLHLDTSAQYNLNTIEDRYIQKIETETLENVINSFVQTLLLCIKNDGRYFKHLYKLKIIKFKEMISKYI